MVIQTVPNQLGRQGRKQRFEILNETYGNPGASYAVFVYRETKTYEYSNYNTERDYLYVCEGNLERLLHDLEFWEFNKNEFSETKKGVLTLKLIKTNFDETFLRKPKKQIIKGTFYLVSDDEFQRVPFQTEPITEKRNVFWSTKLNDSVEMTEALERYIQNSLSPIKTTESDNNKMKYIPIRVEGVEQYVPDSVNHDAFDSAVKHELTNLEFNFLNYFYETKKALRNDVGQLFFDINSTGIGWDHDRN